MPVSHGIGCVLQRLLVWAPVVVLCVWYVLVFLLHIILCLYFGVDCMIQMDCLRYAVPHRTNVRRYSYFPMNISKYTCSMSGIRDYST